MVEKNERILWLDIARAIAIILVVCGHCDNFTTWSIQSFSGLFFMPLFIFISGYLFKDRVIDSFSDLTAFLKRRVVPIYKYYLTYELVFYFLKNFFFQIGFYSSAVLYGDKIIHPVSSLGTVATDVIKIVLCMGREPFCGAFWFFIALIFVTIAYAFIRFIGRKLNNIIDENITVNAGVMACFILGCIMRYTVNIPRFSPSLTLILFYHLGNIYFVNRERVNFDNGLICLISFILLLILNHYGYVSMNQNMFTDPIFLIVSSFLGIYMVFYISKVLDGRLDKARDVLVYIGQNTLPIIAFHLFCFKFVMLAQLFTGYISFDQLAILNGANNNNLWYIAYVLCGVFGPLAIDWIISNSKDKIKHLLGTS